MKTTEFRIGNNITANGKIISIGIIKKDFISWEFSNSVWNPMIHISNENLKPILLTESMLDDLGFVYNDLNGDDGHWEKWSVRILKGEDGLSYNYTTDLKYFHHLQNLYFAITGEEISLTPGTQI
jgi:hypothetical protein